MLNIEKTKEEYLSKGYHYCGVITPLNQANGGCSNLVRNGQNGCLWHEGEETEQFSLSDIAVRIKSKERKTRMIDWDEVGAVIAYSLLGLVIVAGIAGIVALQIAFIVG